MKKLDTPTETNIIARIARGDTYKTIQADLEKEGTQISLTTIASVKGRNEAALEYIRNKMVEHEAKQSTKLLGKSRQLLERKLDRALKQDDALEKLEEDYKAGEIDGLQFGKLIDKALKSELSVQELTSLSKEMFNQSQVEQGKPTSISENPAQAKENLEKLLRAINEKDDTKILEAIFPDVERHAI